MGCGTEVLMPLLFNSEYSCKACLQTGLRAISDTLSAPYTSANGNKADRSNHVKRFVLTSALALLTACVSSGTAFATTYYVAATGADSNNGTAKTSPWLHAPGMPNCSATCASIAPKAGDSIILRGGDTWSSSSFPWTWKWNGAGGNPIQVGGLDQTWFSGAAWTRPILNGGGTFPNNGSNQIFFFSLSGASYVTVAWMEFTGFYIGSNATEWVGYLDRGANGTNINIHDNYFHGWTHAAGISEGGPGGNVTAILCRTGGTDATTSVYRNVIDGSDTAKDDFTGIYATGGCGNVYQNYIAWIPDAVNEASIVSFHDNYMANDGGLCFPGCQSHNNVMEENSGPAGMNSFFYNNYFFSPASTNNAGGIVLQLAPTAGQTSWFFNNVITNGPLYQANELMCSDALGSGGGVCTIFNNTMEGGADASPPSGIPVRAGTFNGSASPSAINLYNNHTISSSNPMYTTRDCKSGCAVTQSPNPNLIQSKAKANSQGYKLTQPFSFSPASSMGATVGTGTNETSLCTAIAAMNPAAGTACQSDTTYGVVYDATNHIVTGPGRTTVARPSSGPWDAGAYEWNSSSGAQPIPPTSVKAVAQ